MKPFVRGGFHALGQMPIQTLQSKIPEPLKPRQNFRIGGFVLLILRINQQLARASPVNVRFKLHLLRNDFLQRRPQRCNRRFGLPQPPCLLGFVHLKLEQLALLLINRRVSLQIIEALL